MQLTPLDIRLRLQMGYPLPATETIWIEPYTIDEVVRFGYSKYEQLLQWLTLEKTSLIEALDEDKKEIAKGNIDKLEAFDFYIQLGSPLLQDYLLLGLAMVFKTEDVVLNSKKKEVYLNFVREGLYVMDESGQYKPCEDFDQRKEQLESKNNVFTVHRYNFEAIRRVVKWQNNLESVEQSDKPSENPADEETRLLMEQMKAMRQKVETIKKAQAEQENRAIDFASIVSAVGSKSHSINRLLIGQLSIFALYDEYSRLELIDSHATSIQAMMNGAKDVKLIHWSSKL